ncbi:hypothetical protein ACWG0Q_27200 [Actinacidiphila sp. SB3-2]
MKPQFRCGSPVLALLVCGLLAAPGTAYAAPADPSPVPRAPGHRLVERYEGAPAPARPVPGEGPPQNPYLADNGRSGMHGDAASSDTHPFPGPQGRDPRVRSAAMAPVGGECATLTFDRGGRIVTVCGTFQGFRVKLLEPGSLRTLAEYRLPQRPSTVEAVSRLDFSRIFKDTSGGAYAYLDHRDRLVLADSRQHILRLSHRQKADGTWEFRKDADWDLTRHVPHDCVSWTNLYPKGQCDPVTSVAPDWDGRIWWVTRQGRIGTVDPRDGAVRSTRLRGEEIQNSFSTGPDGVSIVSDHALYAFRADRDGTPAARWRTPYDRGTRSKPGSVNQGSGTTPTLLGEGRGRGAGRYVAITDNADDRMHLQVHRRTDGSLVCKVPLFRSGASTTDNSLIGWGRSLVAENNYGYENPTSLLLGKSVPGGITRVDVRKDGSGCDTVWESEEKAPSSVPKLSTGNGLLYFYTKQPDRRGIDAWYLTAVDHRTGKTRWKRLTGTGPFYDNNWAPITIGPDGTAYAGVFNGLVSVRDR